jgi:hypothetical protein
MRDLSISHSKKAKISLRSEMEMRRIIERCDRCFCGFADDDESTVESSERLRDDGYSFIST